MIGGLKKYFRKGRACRALLLGTLLGCGQGAFAEQTGLPFLSMNVGAHSQSMGGAYIAEVRDGSANAWNPSAIVNMEKRDLFFYHSQFISGYSYNYGAYAHPFPSRNAGFGLAYARLSKGTFQSRNDKGEPTGEFGAADSLFTLSYARRVASSASIGFSANYVRSSIESESTDGFVFDLAGSYVFSRRTRAALGLFHAGPTLSYLDQTFRLPTTVAGGISHQIFAPLTITSDARYGVNDQKFTLSFGGQVHLAQMASFRLGYASQLTKSSSPRALGSDNKINSLSGLGMGVGLSLFSRAALDYAFVPMAELGGTHHIDLSWRY